MYREIATIMIFSKCHVLGDCNNDGFVRVYREIATIMILSRCHVLGDCNNDGVVRVYREIETILICLGVSGDCNHEETRSS